MKFREKKAAVLEKCPEKPPPKKQPHPGDNEVVRIVRAAQRWSWRTTPQLGAEDHPRTDLDTVVNNYLEPK